MNAPHKFVRWLADRKHRDRKYGYTYLYHPRSDAHSIALCTFVLEDILVRCRVLQEQVALGAVAYGVNIRHTWPNGKQKTIDLSIGRPTVFDSRGSAIPGIKKALGLSDVFISCEAKTVMTEHKKSQPRIFDELGSSHEIVHQGRSDVIAAGVTVVNIAQNFISPLRQTTSGQPYITKHRQPAVTESMVKHLRMLRIRDEIGQVGFDAYCTFVVECDNLAACSFVD
jgi:hypothetical protein